MDKRLQKKELKIRRAQLMTALGAESMVIIFATCDWCAGDQCHPNSDFYYLTGFIERGAVAVFAPGRSAGEFIVFSQENNPKQMLWHEPYIGQRSVCSIFGADQAFALSAISHVLSKLFVKYKHIYTNISLINKCASQIDTWRKYFTANKLKDIGNIVHEMRLKKSYTEIQTIRKAIDISTRGCLRAMRACRPGMFEYELEAEILYEFARLGARQMAFPAIIAGGTNACILHYSQNQRKLLAGELVLIDAGAKYQNYCADLARTFPVNGKFTLKQQALYEVVLATQLEVIKNIKPGITWDQLQTAAETMLTSGLIQLKLLNKSKISTLLAQKQYEPFFMHKIGHWLGLDVHDVGDYNLGNKWRMLEPGMIFTIEPGIYVRPNIPIKTRNKSYLGMGVRIEDVVLVTPKGCEILSANLPKTVIEIEATLR